MQKPYTPEIIKLLAAHSPLSAAYASAMKWDFWRRQKVEDIKEEALGADCAFCTRYDHTDEYGGRKSCPLHEIFGGCCHVTEKTFYLKALTARSAQDQQAFTQSANDLYYLIMKIIDELYEPEPKKEEKFYHIGQRLRGRNGEYLLTATEDEKVGLINLRDGFRYSDAVRVESCTKITEAEIKQICSTGIFTLIEAKECKTPHTTKD